MNEARRADGEEREERRERGRGHDPVAEVRLGRQRVVARAEQVAPHLVGSTPFRRPIIAPAEALGDSAEIEALLGAAPRRRRRAEAVHLDRAQALGGLHAAEPERARAQAGGEADEHQANEQSEVHALLLRP